MKKKTTQKLQLTKVRIASLQPSHMKALQGGVPTTTVQSNTCPGNEQCYSGIIACVSNVINCASVAPYCAAQ